MLLRVVATRAYSTKGNTAVKNLTTIGSGRMGSGIAQARNAQADLNVALVDQNQALLDKAKKGIKGSVKRVAKKLHDNDEKQQKTMVDRVLSNELFGGLHFNAEMGIEHTSDETWQKTLNGKLRSDFNSHRRKQNRKKIEQKAKQKSYHYIVTRDVDGLLKYAQHEFEKEANNTSKWRFNSELYLCVIKFIESELHQMASNANWETDPQFDSQRKEVRRYLGNLMGLFQTYSPKNAGPETEKEAEKLIKCLKIWIPKLDDPKLAMNFRITFNEDLNVEEQQNY